MPQNFHTIFITADPGQAEQVAVAGVDRVMVDLEINGKDARQGHLDTIISRHDPQSVAEVAHAVSQTQTEVLVRLNPVFAGSQDEVDQAISQGADRLMLPMFRGPAEVAHFLTMVGGRVPVTLLLETAPALSRLPQILALEGDYDLHIGLNDLHLEMGLDFMFELFPGGIVAHVMGLCHAAARPCGIGGVARLGGQGALAAEVILAEHLHLGSAGVILSRDWRTGLEAGTFAQDLSALREYMHSKPQRAERAMEQAIADIAASLQARREKLE